jgi:hypothetical protein
MFGYGFSFQTVCVFLMQLVYKNILIIWISLFKIKRQKIKFATY